MMSTIQYKRIDILIQNNSSFALYRLPHGNDIHLVMQDASSSITTLHSIEALGNAKGFIVAPFHISHRHPLVVIHPDVKLEGESAIFSFLQSSDLHMPTTRSQASDILPKHHTPASYQQVFDTFVNGLNSELKKLVLSRTLSQTLSPNFSAGISFKQAIDKYPSNFVYLLHTPHTGTWLGSTPELLLSGQGEQWQTVALAGTKPIAHKAEQWDKKNRVEQKIVVDYVLEQLGKAGATAISHTPPHIIVSGDIIHLKTNFDFRLHKDHISTALNYLHPTPAVCGYPKESAFDFILTNEGYDRRYYSGFVGYLDADLQTDIYVNLRCMEQTNNELILYAGGGILPTSQVAMEWDETDSKLNTMLSIIYQ